MHALVQVQMYVRVCLFVGLGVYVCAYVYAQVRDHVHAVAPMSHHVDIGDVGVKCQDPSLMWCKGEGEGRLSFSQTR